MYVCYVRLLVFLQKVIVLQDGRDILSYCLTTTFITVFTLHSLPPWYPTFLLCNIHFIIILLPTISLGSVARIGDRTYTFTVLVGRLDGKRQLGRPRRRWEDNIEIWFHEVGGGMDWIDLTQDRDRFVGCCEFGIESLGFIKCGQFLDLLKTG